MINVDQANQIVQSFARDFGVEEIPLNEGIGRVLREEWYCDRPMPPYDRVTMDGIAINYDIATTQEHLLVDGIVAAGDPEATLINPLHCLEVMTGAMLPQGTDTIIRYEDITLKNGIAKVNSTYRKNQNIHWKGQDRKKNELLVPSGSLLSASEIGVGASIGKHVIKVSKFPSTIIISTGNELVEIEQVPLPHQIRRGNVYRIQATLKEIGLIADTAHIKDDKEETINTLSAFLEDYDLIILSGGVSKGKFDFLPSALESCGVDKHFHKVAQRPGKPLWFGTHLGKETTVFALPGNPISSFMCLTIYVLDWMTTSMRLKVAERPLALLSDDVLFKPELTYFLEVKLSFDTEGRQIATPQKGNGSGDLANLLNADAFIKLPEGQDAYKKGSVYSVYKYR